MESRRLYMSEFSFCAGNSVPMMRERGPIFYIPDLEDLDALAALLADDDDDICADIDSVVAGDSEDKVDKTEGRMSTNSIKTLGYVTNFQGKQAMRNCSGKHIAGTFIRIREMHNPFIKRKWG